MPVPAIRPSSAMPVNEVGMKAKKPSDVVAAHTAMKPAISRAARGNASWGATPAASNSRYCMHKYNE